MKKLVCTLLSAVTLASCASVAFAAEEITHPLGDVNLDGSVNISDVTALQKHLAKLTQLEGESETLADMNLDGKLDINDCTAIQAHTAVFSIDLTNKKGVDISSNNGSVDIEKVKNAGYDFVMIRCGYGNDEADQDDTRFEENVKKCEEAGIPWGVYIYSYALNTTEAKSEAKHVLRLLKGKKPKLPIAFDMEDADGYKARYGMPSNKTLVKICKTFLKTISDAGYYGMLYANLNWLENKLNDESLLSKYDLWVAQWNETCQYEGAIGMWQYGGETNYLESNSIAGVGIVDKNICYKDYVKIIVEGGYNGWGESEQST